MKEKTLSIIKPDAVERNLIGKILAVYEEKGLKIVDAKLMKLTLEDAKIFYAVHSERPFFQELTEYMSRSPVFVSVLEGENAVALHRELMGATNPKDAAEGTVRAQFALSVGENSVHGSDSLDNAKTEVRFFFPDS